MLSSRARRTVLEAHHPSLRGVGPCAVGRQAASPPTVRTLEQVVVVMEAAYLRHDDGLVALRETVNKRKVIALKQ